MTVLKKLILEKDTSETEHSDKNAIKLKRMTVLKNLILGKDTSETEHSEKEQ